MTRRPNTLERREQITGAMIRLLARRGLQGATMQALSRETGLTQGLLHYHFASKDEVVLAAVERLAAGILARVRAAPGPDGRGHASGEPASGEPASGEPASGEPAGGEPASGEPAGGEPASGEPAGGEPAGGDSVGTIVAALLGVTPDGQAAENAEALRAWLAIGDACQWNEPVRLAWAGALTTLRDRVHAALSVSDAQPDPSGQAGPCAPGAVAAMVVATVEGAWRLGVLAPGLIPPGEAAGALAAWLGTQVPRPLPADPASPPASRLATGLPGPALPAPADLGIRLAAKERGWLDRVMRTAPAILPTSVWQAVASAYTTPGRHYHTLEHLAELADRYAEVQCGPGWKDPSAVWLALLFHDVVYGVDPSQAPGDNERRSADMLLALVPGALAAAELIRATANHTEPPPVDHADPHDLIHFLDADLSILGASPSRFARYSRQIAAEYVPVVGSELYEAGRSAFMARMCQAPTLFHTDWFRARCEAAARKNLRAAVVGSPGL